MRTVAVDTSQLSARSPGMTLTGACGLASVHVTPLPNEAGLKEPSPQGAIFAPDIIFPFRLTARGEAVVVKWKGGSTPSPHVADPMQILKEN